MSEDTSEAGSSEANNSSKDGYSKVIRASEVGGLEDDPTSEVHPHEKDSNEARDGSSEASQLNKSFKYTNSHQGELILRNKDNPRNTWFAFRDEHSIQWLLSMIDPTYVDEAFSEDD